MDVGFFQATKCSKLPPAAREEQEAMSQALAQLVSILGWRRVARYWLLSNVLAKQCGTNASVWRLNTMYLVVNPLRFAFLEEFC